MKTDIIPPERMKLILVESAKARLFSEVRTFICTNCWDYLEMIRIKDLPNKPECPKCGSTALGVLRREEDEVISLVEKKGERLTKNEKKWQGQALETAQLMSKYDKPAAVALAGRRLRASDVEEILRKDSAFTDRFFELVIEAEKKALKRRFW
jgi:ATP-dependent Lhr-like helicase